MLSAAEGKRQRQALSREIDKSHRDKARATLRTLRGELQAERVRRNEALVRVKCHCRAARAALRDTALARRKAALAALKETYAKERADAREECLRRKAEVHAQAKDPIERARGKWHAERAYQADLRRIEQGNRDRHRSVARAHANERRSESDDAVRANLSPEYLPLFERVKKSIRGTERESRTEVFLRYVEEHPSEVWDALDTDSDRIVRQLEAERSRAERTARPPPSSRRRYTPEELASVPF